MCAIAGVVGIPTDQDLLERMLSTMVRRGPDGRGVLSIQGCSLLHTRLAIIDPAGGAQPMSLRWGEERFDIVYNGELYNTQALRTVLQGLGHRFNGRSDTEVILHAYAQWGDECVDRFNGIYAFAIWEEGARRLFLARDRIGVKPLFYMLHQGGLLFASEIKTILEYPTVERRLDAEGAAQITMLGPGRISGTTPFRGIHEVGPGHKGYYQDGRLKLERYWRLTDREHTDDLETTADMVRFLVEDSIRRQMVSDVPIGCFLSGGLDSSIISAICAREIQGLDTFSVDYRDNGSYFKAGKFQPETDGAYIDLMKQEIGGKHHWTVLDTDDLLGALEDATDARDLPGMADVDQSLFVFCKDIRNHVKVALSGECADEIFGGYPWFRDPEIRALDGFPWAQNTDLRVSLMHPDLRRKIDGHAFVGDLYQSTIRDCDILPGTSTLEKRMKQMICLNFQWFMQTLLDRKDRMSMYHGLEVRVPFCDHRIAEYMYGVPWSYKDLHGREKGLLRYAMRGLLPDRVLYRKKSPYPKTYDPGYMDKVKARLQALLERKDAPLFALFDRNAIRSLLEQDPVWPWYGQLMGRPQTFAYLLQVGYWLEKYKISIL